MILWHTLLSKTICLSDLYAYGKIFVKILNLNRPSQRSDVRYVRATEVLCYKKISDGNLLQPALTQRHHVSHCYNLECRNPQERNISNLKMMQFSFKHKNVFMYPLLRAAWSSFVYYPKCVFVCVSILYVCIARKA